MVAQEEEGQCAGAGVGTDHRAYIVGKDLLDTAGFFQFLCHVVYIVLAITVAVSASIRTAPSILLKIAMRQARSSR